MRAVVQHRYGGPETLELEEVGRPTSGSEQVLVLVRAAALNPTDYVVMRGRLRVQTGVLNCGHDVSLILAGNVARLLFRRRDVNQFVRKVRRADLLDSPGSRRTGARRPSSTAPIHSPRLPRRCGI
jgi:hypothetical protein